MFLKFFRLIKFYWLGIHFRSRTYQESVVSFERSKPLLIVGLPRSGTSLLYSLLNELEAVYMSYEAVCEPFLFERNKFRLASFYYEVIRQANHINKNISDLSNLKRNIYDYEYCYLGNKSIFRTNFLYRYRLRKLIGNGEVKVIFISREVKDRLSSVIGWNNKRDSIYRNTKLKEVSINEFVAFELQKNLEFSRYKEKFHNYENVISIKYEDLVNDSSVLDEIINFLSIDGVDRSNFSSLSDISSLSVGAWKGRVSTEVRDILEKQCDLENKD